MKSKFFLSLLCFFILAGAGCSFSKITKQQDTPLIPVTLKLKWLHQAQFAGNYVAKEKGMYENEGLDVTLEPFSFDSPTIDAVISGEAEFGITGADELVLARLEGYPLKAVAVIYKINPVAAYALKDSGITKPEHFIGKTIGLERAADGTDINVGILYLAMMSRLGIDRSDINEITIGYDATELIEGTTDVSTGYIINEPHLAIEEGEEVDTILMADYGVNMYADVLFTTEDTIQEKPDVVRGVVKATLDGWRYAIDNQEEAVSIVLQYAPERTQSHELYMLRTSVPLIRTGDEPIGWMESREWESLQNILLSQRILSTPIGIEKAYTTDFLFDIYGRTNKENIPVRLSWLHQNQFAGFYVADQLGYYDDEGLNVELHTVGYNVPIEESITSGIDVFGLTSGSNFLKKIDEGEDLVAVAALYQKDPTVFISKKEVDLVDIHDLSEKTVAGVSAQEDILKMLLKKNDLMNDIDSFVTKTYGIFSLEQEGVDVLAGFSIDEEIEAKKVYGDVNVLHAEDLGVGGYNNVLFAERSYIEENPEVVRSFVSSTLRGWRYAVENPEKAALFVSSYDVSINPTHQDTMMKESVPYIKPDQNTVLGKMNLDQWVQIEENLRSIGLLQNEIDIESIFTNRYIAS